MIDYDYYALESQNLEICKDYKETGQCVYGDGCKSCITMEITNRDEDRKSVGIVMKRNKAMGIEDEDSDDTNNNNNEDKVHCPLLASYAKSLSWIQFSSITSVRIMLFLYGLAKRALCSTIHHAGIQFYVQMIIEDDVSKVIYSILSITLLIIYH
ncbi:hypothetical protein Bca4012_037889 [Brassica carinata]